MSGCEFYTSKFVKYACGAITGIPIVSYIKLMIMNANVKKRILDHLTGSSLQEPP
jgi:hypothetical protein